MPDITVNGFASIQRLRRNALLGALAVAVLSAPVPVWAVLRIGSIDNQNILTTQPQANAIADYLKLISGHAVNLAQTPNSGRPFWTVTLGAQQGAIKPIGDALVSALINSNRTVTITARAGGNEGVTSCANGFQKVQLGQALKACREQGGQPGVDNNGIAGSDAIVELAPPLGASVLTDASTPQYVIVAHELIHALHVTIGRQLTPGANNEARTIGPYNGYNGQQPPLIPAFQFTENAIRGENTYTIKGVQAPLNCREPYNTAQYPTPPNLTC
jgi:hypothetical protein